MLQFNMFEKAISNSELLSFAYGKGEYLIRDREYDEHSIINSWTSHVIPFQSLKPELCNENLLLMFDQLIEDSKTDLEIKMETILYHTYSYYYLLREERVLKLNFLGSSFLQRLQQFINHYIKSNLTNEQRQNLTNSLNMINSKGGLNIMG